ncbi:TlpA family protein disulfide reductase [Hydrogenophaga flava]|uniref:TlpA family protein disulfide reductase n=1 Tax=Hydrogenophaga flava TaxID=65657 RepID=UPI0008245388|nr:TlpA disulfide reductase family protein [Hydrogenophaga flava]
MNRRTLLMAGLGAAAAAAGAGVAWWRLRPGPVLGEAENQFWASAFPHVAGAPVSMAGFRGRPLLVNFWATWCPPCVEELPLINTFYKEHSAQGWQVLGLAVDQAAPVSRFLTRLPLDFPVALAGFAGSDMARSLGNPSGALPFSVVFGVDGSVLHRKLGKVSAEELTQWAQLV